MERMARELLRALRGQRSQVAFARRLGYKANPVADWEAGRRFPTALEMLRAYEKVTGDVVDALARFHPSTPSRLTDGTLDVASWLSALRGSASAQDIAARAKLSRHQVSRWLRGQTQPRLPDFLRVLDAITGRATDLVAELVPIDRVPSAVRDWQRRQAARSLAHEEPWTEAILRVIESRPYRGLSAHSTEFVADALDLSLDTVQRCVDKLDAAGIIAQRGGRYEPVQALTVDTRAIGKLREHWAGVAAERVRAPRSDDIFSYNVLSASRADIDRIDALLRATFREIRMIVANTSEDEVAALVNLQLVRWGPRA
jgi:transcriptional regulator with XRE-family HTH domain